jgi:hypothetical protein
VRGDKVALICAINHSSTKSVVRLEKWAVLKHHYAAHVKLLEKSSIPNINAKQKINKHTAAGVANYETRLNEAPGRSIILLNR